MHNVMYMLLVSYGTRPEYIKVKSIIDNFTNIVTLFTGQHADLIGNHNPNIILNVDFNTSNRLNDIVCSILSHPNIFDGITAVVVQGDTTSAMSVALSAFHCGVKIIHLEAGLRTYDVNDPYPEEFNRQLISRIASIHLCPTELNKENLIKEGIDKNCIYVTGNPGLDNIDISGCTYENVVLVTLHRRDNIPIIADWFSALNNIAKKYHNLLFIFPMHPNSNIQKYKNILERKNISVVQPMTHDALIDTLKCCLFVVSDSGGIQEEASFLNKRIIVCRKTTERPETIGRNSILCPNPSNLENCVQLIYANYFIDFNCPYGDGNSWKRIKNVLEINNVI